MATVFLSLELDVYLDGGLIDTDSGDKIANRPNCLFSKVAMLKEGEFLLHHTGDIGLNDFNRFGDGSEPEKQNFKFLKQYLTLNKAELFFSDKIVFIEGDTERMLLPAMMKKLDEQNSSKDYQPVHLCSFFLPTHNKCDVGLWCFGSLPSWRVFNFHSSRYSTVTK